MTSKRLGGLLLKIILFIELLYLKNLTCLSFCQSTCYSPLRKKRCTLLPGGTDVYIQRHIHQKDLNLCLPLYYYAKVIAELKKYTNNCVMVLIVELKQTTNNCIMVLIVELKKNTNNCVMVLIVELKKNTNNCVIVLIIIEVSICFWFQ